jgi:hypothetical protein
MELYSHTDAIVGLTRLVALYGEQKALKAALRRWVQVHGPLTAGGYTAKWVDRPTVAYPALAVLNIVHGDPNVAPLMFNRTAVRPLLLPPSPYAQQIADVGIRETYPVFEIIKEGA